MLKLLSISSIFKRPSSSPKRLHQSFAPKKIERARVLLLKLVLSNNKNGLRRGFFHLLCYLSTANTLHSTGHYNTRTTRAFTTEQGANCSPSFYSITKFYQFSFGDIPSLELLSPASIPKAAVSGSYYGCGIITIIRYWQLSIFVK